MFALFIIGSAIFLIVWFFKMAETSVNEKLENIKAELNLRVNKIFIEQNLTISQQYLSVHYSAIGIDETTQELCFLDSKQTNTVDIPDKIEYLVRTFSYKDLLESEIIIDGATITKTSRTSQIGGALIGTVLAGGVGAIIGGLSGKTTSTEKVKKIQLKIVVNDIVNPLIEIAFLDELSPIDRNHEKYKNANNLVSHWHSLLKVLIERADKDDRKINQANVESNQSITISSADEIRKLYELLKDGIITQQEYELQKQKVMQ